MARPSPLTTIVIGLAVTVLGAVTYVAVRAISRPDRRTTDDRSSRGPVEAEPPPSPLPQARLPATAVAREIPPAPAEEAPRTPAEPAPSAAAIDDASVVVDSDRRDRAAAISRRRALLADWHSRWRQEADEQVLAAMKLPDPTRAAIRKINEDFTARTLASSAGAALDAGAPAARPSANFSADAAAEQVRRDALGALLGGGVFAEFDAAERVALQRLRGKYRFERARLLQR